MSKAEPMKVSERLDRHKASGRRKFTPRQQRRYMHKVLHLGAPYWPQFEDEMNPDGKNRPTPRQRKPRRDG